MFSTLEKYLTRPLPYTPSSAPFWADPHISKGMLDAHLNPGLDSASRNLDFIKESSRWIAQIAPPEQFPALLDLGCGPGIYAEQFNELGYKVTGVDLSARSIEYAKQAARQKNLDIKYILADYLKLDADLKADAVTLIYCDFGVLPDTSRSQLLHKIFQLLNPGGKFIFDVFSPQKYKDIQESRSWELSDGGFWHPAPHICLNALYRYDRENTFLQQYVVITEHELNCYNIWEHVFSIEELKRDLEKAGFRDLHFYGNIAGKPNSTQSETICVVATK